MRYEKNYLITFHHGVNGYPTTVLVNACNKDEAKERCRDFVERNLRANIKPEIISEEMIANAKADLIFHFGIVANTIIDIRL